MRKTGFTLLELLIVVIIIGVLASIAMSQYSGAIANSKNAYAKSTLDEMRKAAIAYESLNRAWPSVFPINADLNLDTTNEVSFVDPTNSNSDFTFTLNAGTGVATKKTGAGAGVSNWTINFSTGVISAS